MKKTLLLFLSSFVVFLWSCNKEPNIDHTPPTGVWEELIWVPVLSENDKITGYERVSFSEMCNRGKMFEDTLMYTCAEIDFGDGNQMKVTIRYGDGKYDSCNGSHQRIDYYVATRYWIGEDGVDSDNQKYKYIDADYQYTDDSFVVGSEPSECSSKGTFSRKDDFAYEDEEKKQLRIGYAAPGRVDIPLFRRKE